MQYSRSYIGALFLAAPFVISGVGCTGSTSSDGSSLSHSTSTGNQPPVMVLAKFVHDPIPLSEPIAVQALAEDPDHDTVTYAYQWYVNGAPVTGQTNSTFPIELLRRGQMVSVEVTPFDGKQQGKAARTPATMSSMNVKSRPIRPSLNISIASPFSIFSVKIR